LADLHQLLSDEMGMYRDDIKGYAEGMRGERNKLGPRQRKRLHQHMIDEMPQEESLPVIQALLAGAKHVEGERVPCAACRFLGEGEK
jgi:hypothetical protein